MRQNSFIKFAAVGVLGLALVFGILAGCGGGTKEALPVDDLSRGSVTMVENTTDATIPPVTYTVKVAWSTASITADETANTAITKLVASGGVADAVDLALTDSSYTFTGLVPGERYHLNIAAVYAEGTYESGDGASDSVSFIGGPWYHDDITIGSGGFKTDSFSSGSFNQADAISSTDDYYFNFYNKEYALEGEDWEVWLIVDVNEPTTTNDEDDQRNNINWMNSTFHLLDNETVTDDADIAAVDLKIYNVYGDEVLDISGSVIEGTISGFGSFLDTVNSGYYADKNGVFFVRAVCSAMPSTYSDWNEDQFGWWGLAMPGPRTARDAVVD